MSQPPPARTEIITLRNLEIARRYPLEVPEDAPRRRRGEHHVCPDDGTPFVPAVLTTFGEFGDPAVWRAHPLVIEGWKCAAGSHFEYAFLTPQDVDQLFRSGMEAVRAGDLDLAEFSFRRVVSSWPGYATGRVNLGSIYLDRVKAAQSRSAPAAEVRALLDVAVEQFERALACVPPPPAEVRLMLGRIYARSDRTEKARPLLEGLRGDPAASQALKEQAKALLDEIGARSAPASASAPPPAAVPSVPPPGGARVAHPYVELSLPARWSQVEAPEGLFAAFEGPDHEAVNVVLAEAPAPCDAKAKLAAAIEVHEAAVRRNYARCEAAPPEILAAGAHHIEARRRFQVQGNGPPWSVFARYAVSTTTLAMRDGRTVHPFVQMVYYGSVWEPSQAVIDAISNAAILPALGKMAAAGAAPMVPYLVTADHLERRDALLVTSGRTAEGAAGLLTLAPGVHLTVAVDGDEGVRPLFGADLADRKVSVADALAEARRTLEARLGTPELPVHTYSTTPFAIPPIWREGMHAVVKGTDTMKVLVVGPSWMAASAAATGALFRRAAEELGTTALRVLVPHRDRVFVFPENVDDEEANKTFAAGIARAEADGAKPISDKMFGLDAGGVTPAGRRALQWTLLSARKGATRAEVEAELPVDVKWRWTPGDDRTPDRLAGEHWRSPPFTLAFEFEGGGLRAVRILAAVEGDFGALVDLDTKLRQSLPDVRFVVTGGKPWDVEIARPIVENKGSAAFKMATVLQARIPGFGDLFGKAFGFKTKHGAQGYGFEIGYQPGRFFLEGMD
jgi:hypothetical protein